MHFYEIKVNFEGSELFVISEDRKQISVSCLVCKQKRHLCLEWQQSFFTIKQVTMLQEQQHKNGRMKDLWTTLLKGPLDHDQRSFL